MVRQQLRSNAALTPFRFGNSCRGSSAQRLFTKKVVALTGISGGEILRPIQLPRNPRENMDGHLEVHRRPYTLVSGFSFRS